MLNPSTADASIDDPTIKRCIAFSTAWGYGSLLVGNLYAYRSTDPVALSKLTDAEAIGPENAYHLSLMGARADKIICAWGTHGAVYSAELPNCDGGRWHLGLTKYGQPRHPLYVKGDTQLRAMAT